MCWKYLSSSANKVLLCKECILKADNYVVPKSSILCFLIDDETTIQKSVKAYLEYKNSNIEVRIFESGIKALLEIGKASPDIVILDYKLPDMDGLAVCREFKLREELKNTKIIAISGYFDDQKKDMILQAGANCYLNKPLDMEVLYQRVVQLTSLDQQFEDTP